jgi:CBS domain-containing protein
VNGAEAKRVVRAWRISSFRAKYAPSERVWRHESAGRPIGMLTDRDITVEVVAKGLDPDAIRVADVMRKKPVTIRDDLGILDAAKAFAKTGVRRLPVVTKKGILVGVIAVDDLIMLLGNEMGQMAGALAAGLRRAS